MGSLNALDLSSVDTVNQLSPSSQPEALESWESFRQFWKAGNYEVGKRLGSTKQDGKYQLCVHPMFLHSNATSHKWVFGAIAELVDNAIDEVQNGATFVYIDKISNPRDGSPALLIQDDGGGMDREAVRRCMSFGFSDKQSKHAIGQYGNGFKTGCMRLGADVIVFTRNMKNRTLTQSIGLLSYTFLRQMGYERIVVPMVDYEFKSSTNTFGPILEHGKEQFASNLSMLLKWSPYGTEEELLQQFENIGHHGTRMVIYNLWLNNDGAMELDFDSDHEDIYINGHPKICKGGDSTKSSFHQHIANRYHYSLRAYLSILYWRLPQCFNVILRGTIVQHHNIVSDLKFPEIILYKPHQTGNTEVVVVTTIGFVKDAPNLGIEGYCIYHRNRLILPFWLGRKVTTGSVGRGVEGVLEANFVEPTHNKQEFEKTCLFQKLDDRLKQMKDEYWRLHCELIGYKAVRKTGLTPWQDFVVPKRKRSAKSGTGSQQGSNMKRKELTPPETDANHYGKSQPVVKRVENQMEDSRIRILMVENKRLQSKALDLEKQDKELNMKVQQLRIELQNAQHEYTLLLQESRSLPFNWLDYLL
ncbi:hypothetical protein CCACVL1_24991 [Corchorus capsularis]|uniref:Morc S5 domain-containing protein n=1 Tax=Corchorus capsularis TaxID=210143 RepID=A0A1R3GM79_COCAP|nr:hypothetical protein CCACVL1_24991 [Corchorus capsularis]